MTELRFAVTQLRRRPGFAFGAALSLALGMALATSVFSMVAALFIRPLPFPAAEQLVTLYKVSPGFTGESRWLLANQVAALRDRAKSLDGIAAWNANSHIVGGNGDAGEYSGAAVTSNFFDVLRVRPVLGRVFRGESDGGMIGGVVLAHSVWQQQFGADTGIVGRTVPVDGVLRPVIGVLKLGEEFPRGTEIWTLLPDDSLRSASSRDPRPYLTVARLSAGATPAMAGAEATAILHAREAEAGSRMSFRCHVASLAALEASAYRESIELWAAAAIIVTLLCAVNFATMMLARGIRRRSELAVRTALGAPIRRILGLLVSEAGLIALLGGVLAVVLAIWILSVERAIFASSLPIAPILDWRSAAFAILGTTLVGVLFALLPSLDLSRADLRPLLSGGSTAATNSTRELRSRHGLVALQIGLALMCVSVVVSVVRADLRDYTRGPGYSFENMVTAKVRVPDESGWSEAGLLSALRSIPGVLDASILRNLEIAGFKPEEGPPESFPHLAWSDVPPDYFSTVGIGLVAGRLPTKADVATGSSVILLSELDLRFAYPDTATSILGRRLRMATPDGRKLWYTVIGIVRDVRAAPSFNAMTAPIYTVDAIRTPRSGATLFVKVRGDRREQVDRIRNALRVYDGRVVISDVHPAYDDVAKWRARSRGRVVFMVGVSVVALLLALIGVYGLVSYTTALRMHELAIRRALGASDGEIVFLLARNLGWTSIVGAALGVLLSTRAAIALDALVRSPYDRRSLVAFQLLPTIVGAVMLLLVAGCGALIPARRALRVDVAKVVSSQG